MEDLRSTETPMLHAMLVSAQMNRNQHQAMVEQYDREAHAIRSELTRRIESDVLREWIALRHDWEHVG